MQRVICLTTGLSKAEPGRAAIGVIITSEEGVVLASQATVIGNASSVFAQYQAVAMALSLLQQHMPEPRVLHVMLQLDSSTVVQVLSHVSPVTDPGIVPLFLEIHNARVLHFPHLNIQYVSFEKESNIIQMTQAALDGA